MYLSIYVSIYLSLCLSVYLSIYLSICKLENETILRDVLRFWAWQHQKRSNSARLPHFRSWQHQKQSNSARLPAKMESWLQSWRPRVNTFCDFSSPSVETIAPATKKWCQVIRSAAPVTQNHLSKPKDLMLQNATPLRKSAPWPANSSDEHVSCAAPATENASLQFFADPLQMPHACHPFWRCHKTLIFCSHLTRCTIPCACHAKRALNVQKWSECGVLCTFWLRNVLRATTACTFSSLIGPAGSAPAALASLLFDPPEPQIIGKKRLMFGALLEVEMSKKCTLLWREAHFEVKMYKAHHSRTTFGSWDVELDDGWPESEKHVLQAALSMVVVKNSRWMVGEFDMSYGGEVVKLHTDAFTHKHFHRRVYTQRLLHTDAFTHRHFYTQTLLHTEAFTRRCFYTQKLLHTDTFTHKRFYTQTLLHTDPFTHRRFYTQRLLHADAFTHTLSYTEAFTHRSFWRVSLYDILWSWTQTVRFLTSSTWWHRALLQTFADVSLVKYCHMCHLQHHGTDLFWANYVGFSVIKWNNMCHTQHHGTELFWAIYVGFSILKWNDMCHTRHHGTELFW